MKLESHSRSRICNRRRSMNTQSEVSWFEWGKRNQWKTHFHGCQLAAYIWWV